MNWFTSKTFLQDRLDQITKECHCLLYQRTRICSSNNNQSALFPLLSLGELMPSKNSRQQLTPSQVLEATVSKSPLAQVSLLPKLRNQLSTCLMRAWLLPATTTTLGRQVAPIPQTRKELILRLLISPSHSICRIGCTAMALEPRPPKIRMSLGLLLLLAWMLIWHLKAAINNNTFTT